jgi:hypothetical protein
MSQISEDTPTGDAVFGHSGTGTGVHGVNDQGFDQDGPGLGSPPAGVVGESDSATGLLGASTTANGVNGISGGHSGLTPAAGCGVWGDSTAGYGVYATSNSNDGLFGSSKSGDGVHGETTSPSHYGVSALNNSAWPCAAIYGSSANGHGVHGVNQSGSGTTPGSGCGLLGESDQGIGVYGASKSGNAGVFAGNVSVTGNINHTNGNFTTAGSIEVAGDVMLTGGDCAERFDLKTLETAEPGSVMVIDDDGTLRQSETAYDRKVAGVVSGAGAFRPGIVLDQRADNEGRTIIALVGKVFCKVDADAGPIAVGDLLTSSNTPGHAMRVADPLQAFGSVIGKALRPMASGQGLLPILVALQ